MPIPSAPPEPPSPMTTQTIGRADLAHGHQVLGDDRGLASLFGGDSRIGPGRVDERDDRQAELARELHLLQRLAIAFGMGAAEVAGLALGQVFPLLMADEHDLEIVEVGEARDDRLVVAEGAVAVQLEELLEDQIDDSRGSAGRCWCRETWTICQGSRLRIDLALERGQLAAQPADLLGDLGRVARRRGSWRTAPPSRPRRASIS